MVNVGKAKKVLFSLMLLVLTFACLIIIDLLIGMGYDQLAPEFGRNNLSLALSHSVGEEPLLRHRPHPYLTYENTPDYHNHGMRQHNNMGYRNTHDTIIEKAPATIRILALGGSTTYGAGVENPEEAWPSQLQARLNTSLSASLGYHVEVINGGMGWASSAELLNHYIFRDRYLQPDIVILHTGGNDAGPLGSYNYTPEYTHWRMIRSGGGNALRPGEAQIIKASNIVKLIYSIWYDQIGYAVPRAYIHTNGIARLEKEEILSNVRHNEPTGFARNLALLLTLIKEDGALPIYFQFYPPGEELLLGENQSALDNANRNINFVKVFEGIQLAYKKNEMAAQAICTNQHIAFLKIRDGAIPVEYFVDQCHLDRRGQEFKAAFLTQHIVPHILQLVSQKNAQVSR